MRPFTGEKEPGYEARQNLASFPGSFTGEKEPGYEAFYGGERAWVRGLLRGRKSLGTRLDRTW